MPCIVGIIEKSKVDVCNGNVPEVERHYEAYLKLESIEHSDVMFVKYLHSNDGEICLNGGVIIWMREFNAVCILRI